MNKKGFTLIEILLSLMIIAILAVPIVVTIYNHVNIASEATVRGQISFLADNARLLSCSYGVPVALELNREDNTMSLVIPTASNMLPLHNFSSDNISTITSYKMPDSVNIGKISGSGSFISQNRICFYPNGMSDNVNLAINIGDDNVLYTICPYTGRVSPSIEVLPPRIIDLAKMDLSNDDVFR